LKIKGNSNTIPNAIAAAKKAAINTTILLTTFQKVEILKKPNLQSDTSTNK